MKAYRDWISRRIEELGTALNQGKKRGGRGWHSKKQRWHMAQKEWLEMRRRGKQAARKGQRTRETRSAVAP
jgi:hypothetical protein